MAKKKTFKPYSDAFTIFGNISAEPVKVKVIRKSFKSNTSDIYYDIRIKINDFTKTLSINESYLFSTPEECKKAHQELLLKLLTAKFRCVFSFHLLKQEFSKFDKGAEIHYNNLIENELKEICILFEKYEDKLIAEDTYKLLYALIKDPSVDFSNCMEAMRKIFDSDKEE